MIALEQVRQHLETLGLKQAVEVLETPWMPRPAGSCPIRRCWPNCWAWRQPPPGTLPDHSYSAGPSALPAHPGAIRLWLPVFHRRAIDERLVKELANLAFVAEATNVLLLGPPGVGKTHLALRTMENGHGAYFVRAYDLMEDLRKARAQHNLDRRMRVYLAPKVLIVKVLIVDEFGIWPYDRESATAFFTLVSARYGIPKELTSSTPSRCPSGRRGRRRPQNAKPTSTSTVPGRIQCQKCAAKNRDRMNASTLKSERITRLWASE